MGDVNLLPSGKIATGCVKNGVAGDALELALGLMKLVLYRLYLKLSTRPAKVSNLRRASWLAATQASR